jgi:exosortase
MSAPSRPARAALWAQLDPWAVGSSLLVCALLLGCVPYCPSYEAGKKTLLGWWLQTFWSGTTQGATLAGETTANQWLQCAVVPLLAAGLVWWRWEAVRRVPIAGHRLGYVVFAAGAVLYLLGFLMENTYVGYLALEIVYAGLVLLFLGWPMLRLLAFPIAFLLFMWPYNFVEDLALQLRLIMSSLSHHVLDLIGVTNVLHGTAVVSPAGAAQPFAIDIADPCSGIRSLFALVMIACIYAYMMFARFWEQAVIVALAVPVVIAGNCVRIVLLTLADLHFGEKFALGTNNAPSWFHEGAGYLVYLINFGGLILAGTLLEWWSAKTAAAGKSPS